MPITAKIDEFGKPAWIALVILGFMVWWPLGLAALAFAIGSGRMGCRGYGMDRWQRKMERMQSKMDRACASAAAAAPGGSRLSAAAATAPSMNTAARRCGGSKTSSANSTISLIGFAWPRTRPSSISSWPIGATAQIRTLIPRADFGLECRSASRPSRTPRRTAGFALRAWKQAPCYPRGDKSLSRKINPDNSLGELIPAPAGPESGGLARVQHAHPTRGRSKPHGPGATGWRHESLW